MKRTKIYLDTSVISMLDESSLGILTRRFFDVITHGDYELVTSDIVETEIEASEEAKRDAILHFLRELNVTTLSYKVESYNLAWKYVEDGVLTSNHIVDLSHVAHATVYECNVLVSWNRRHIAKESKIQKINACNFKYGYLPIIICTPQYFIDNMLRSE
ncbi:MAG: hypothetical protein LBK06_04270 [Planctomycetaceae bacterium]|jgi:hypothetical protein|nr:hypothetical protein [Planctomycetaceae bacterium]